MEGKPKGNYINSLLDSAPNKLVGFIIQKRRAIVLHVSILDKSFYIHEVDNNNFYEEVNA